MYTKHIEYHFEVQNRLLSVSSISEHQVEVRITEEGGRQTSGWLISTKSGWKWTDRNFIVIEGQELAQDILNFLNANPHPEI